VDFRVHDLRKGFGQHPDGSVDAVYLGQVIEHLNPLHEAPQLVRECRRMLRPGGILRIVTPDLDLLVKAYVERRMDGFSGEFPDFYRDAPPGDQLAYVLYGSAGRNSSWDNYDGHMHLYTQESAARLLCEAGFSPPFFFYACGGESRNAELAAEVSDAGMGHSFVVEAVR
jgi:predicted SAM-dependent methyltransferase